MHFNIILPSTPWFSNWPRSSHSFMPHVPSILPSLIFHRYSRCRWEDNIERKQCTYNIISRCFNVTMMAVKQAAVSIIYSKSVSPALFIQQAEHMRHIILFLTIFAHIL
jgi:hypothetical protein